MRRRFPVLAGLGLSAGLAVPLLLGGRGTFAALAGFPPSWLLLMLLMIMVAWNCNAGRLRLLCGGIGHAVSQAQALGIIMATEFAISATPGGSGGPVSYAYLLHSRKGIQVPRALALYTVDQLMDMLFFLAAIVTLAVATVLLPAEFHLGWQLSVLAGLLVSGLGLVWLLLHHYRRVLMLADWLGRRFRLNDHHRRRLLRRVLEFRNSIGLVRRFPHWRLLTIYCLCVSHWLLRYSILYLAVHGLGGTLSWSYCFLAQMLSLTAGQATLLPGGSGGAEASGALLLAPFLGVASAAAAILVWRFVTFYWYLIAGAPVFALLAGQPLWQRLISNRTKP